MGKMKAIAMMIEEADANKNWGHLNLYEDEFSSNSTWRDICDVVGVDYDAKAISVKFDMDKTESGDNEE